MAKVELLAIVIDYDDIVLAPTVSLFNQNINCIFNGGFN